MAATASASCGAPLASGAHFNPTHPARCKPCSVNCCTQPARLSCPQAAREANSAAPYCIAKRWPPIEQLCRRAALTRRGSAARRPPGSAGPSGRPQSQTRPWGWRPAAIAKCEHAECIVGCVNSFWQAAITESSTGMEACSWATQERGSKPALRPQR